MTDTAPDVLRRRYRSLLEMRHFDEACLEAVKSGDIEGELHLGIGQEAIGAGMREYLRKDDALVSHHRNHFHALAKGVDKERLLAEICTRETGLCRGRGGHMHPFDLENNFSASGIVGAAWPVALGYAYTFRLRATDSVAVAVAGDGAANQGTFHETANIAAAWKLPLVMLVENNGYGISVPADSVLATASIAERAAAYGMWGRRVDGTDADDVADAFGDAMSHARSGRGPALLEATCERFRGHFEGDLDFYRSRREMNERRESRDPVQLYRQKLLAAGISAAEVEEMEERSRAATGQVLARVRQEPSPDPSGAFNFVFVQE